ncbi:hypothetical protein HZS_7814 [Henneguya salminicola]|nr:hypothetical protein HZS_7814 [Henneguya salminicola]
MDEECSICLDVYAIGDIISILKCHHEFHQKCLYFWGGGICPLCRIPMHTVINVEKIRSPNLDCTTQIRCLESIPLLCLEDNLQTDFVQKESSDLLDTTKIQFSQENSNFIAFNIVECNLKAKNI